VIEGEPSHGISFFADQDGVMVDDHPQKMQRHRS
jgi:hypothetical protein